MEKSWQKLKSSIREITRKTSPMGFDERVSKLKELQRGWINYFRLGSITSKLKVLFPWHVSSRDNYCSGMCPHVAAQNSTLISFKNLNSFTPFS
ncbi:MAG: hypothetical protein H7329_02705 [Opitutaceae bacterium]|nr:hypothetical protein [Cytophagales bacterium]